MSQKKAYNEVYQKYISDNYNRSTESYEIEEKIEQLKGILSGDKVWKWKDRLKETKQTLNELSKYALNEYEVKALKGMQSILKNNKYLNKKEEIEVKEGLTNVYSHIDNYAALCNKLKERNIDQGLRNIKQKLNSLEQRLEPMTAARKGSALDKLINKIANVTTAFVIGATLIGGCLGYYARDVAAKKEFAEIKDKKQIVYVVTDKHPFEKESIFSEPKKSIEERLYDEISKPVEEIKETGNKGIFPQGYCYKKNIPEYKKYTPEERERLRKKWANIDEKVKRDTKKFESGLHDLITLKHPIGGALRTVSGFGGVLNCGIRGIVRPLAYFFTGKNDMIDKAIDDFGDASYFGDSYNELHGNVFTLNFQGTGDFIQEHPVKSTISVAEDIIPFLFWKHGGGSSSEEGGAAAAASGPGRSGGAAIGGLIGRSGGAGVP